MFMPELTSLYCHILSVYLNDSLRKLSFAKLVNVSSYRHEWAIEGYLNKNIKYNSLYLCLTKNWILLSVQLQCRKGKDALLHFPLPSLFLS